MDNEGKVEAACVDYHNPQDTRDIMDWIRRGLTVKLVQGPVAMGRPLQPTPAPEPPKANQPDALPAEEWEQAFNKFASAYYASGRGNEILTIALGTLREDLERAARALAQGRAGAERGGD